ncbi:MAG: formylglycine-generating enzyme family protein, partial [Planctomycetia bacterium]|nr:formylglycine-generating enzyme family protein [Planctomycetia bacterium]
KAAADRQRREEEARLAREKAEAERRRREEEAREKKELERKSQPSMPKEKPTGSHAGDRLVKTINGVDYAWRWCPAGEFMMGSPSGEGHDWEKPQHRVTLTQGFWMLETQVTQRMWESVMGNNPSRFKGANLPVECVSWHDCVKFCEKISKLSGLKIQLPTEAQWEYACRAGTTTAYSFGNSCNGKEANCDGNYPYGTKKKGPYLQRTTEVGSYPANAWGLYDMHGNVWEWCSDWYGGYVESPTSDPKGPDSGSRRVRRGGSGADYAECCRSARRSCSAPTRSGDAVGFRLLFVPPSS